MAVRIGHASISENGGINGVSGDSTGREVCVRNYYNIGASYVLRAKDPAVRERMAVACEQGCANNNIGYSQAQRNTLHTKLVQNGYNMAAVGPCNADCSSFMTACAITAGVRALEYTGNAPTTSSMKSKFSATGAFDILTGSTYTGSDKNLLRGDILVKPGSHTVMVLDNGSAIPKPAPAPAPAPSGVYTRVAFVKDLQRALGGLAVDGICGPKTLAKLPTISKSRNNRHAVVKYTQKRLNALGYNCGTADGIAGAKFDTAARNFQRAYGLSADGIIGPNSWKKLTTV